MQEILTWLQSKEQELNSMGPIAADTDAVKQQLDTLRVFKEVVHPKHLDIESLNQQVQELTKDSPTEQASTVKLPMTEVNNKWDALLDGIAERKVRVAVINLMWVFWRKLAVL